MFLKCNLWHALNISVLAGVSLGDTFCVFVCSIPGGVTPSKFCYFILPKSKIAVRFCVLLCSRKGVLSKYFWKISSPLLFLLDICRQLTQSRRIIWKNIYHMNVGQKDNKYLYSSQLLC